MKRLFFMFLAAATLTFGCSKDDSGLPIQSQTFEINSSSSTVWKYFSFTTNDTLIVSNPAQSTSWDLAFQRYRVETNGGLSGIGSGAAANSYLKGQAGFDALKVVPDTTTFFQDKSISVAVQQGYASYIVNPVLYTWFSLEFAAQGTQIVPSNYVYIVRTATGKYAKVWIKSYYSATNQSGRVTIQYKYQPDGSKNLE